MTDACTILTTCGSEEAALTIAAAVVDQGFAACVNILPNVKSYYYFKGETHLDEEVMLITQEGTMLRTQVASVNSYRRASRGVTVMKPAEDDRIISIAVFVDEGLPEESEGEE